MIKTVLASDVNVIGGAAPATVMTLALPNNPTIDLRYLFMVQLTLQQAAVGTQSPRLFAEAPVPGSTLIHQASATIPMPTSGTASKTIVLIGSVVIPHSSTPGTTTLNINVRGDIVGCTTVLSGQNGGAYVPTHALAYPE